VAVAVKENLFLTDEYSRQFQREASILASLRQASLPRVRDYFTIPNQGQYLVMDFIDGEDLRKRIERLGKLPDKDVVLIGVLICDALSYMHSRKPPIVHRDIKPGNIKITAEGEAFLVDFGLAKVMAGSQATSTGARAMTPGFSPPEQYGTARTDPRTDVYSLGATLYAALTGVIPEDGLARATGKEELTPIRELEPRSNRRLAAAIEKALEEEPDDRFQTGDEFRTALLEAGELSQLTISRITISPPPARPPKEGEQESEEESAFRPVFLEQEPSQAPVSRGSRPKRRRPLHWAWVAVPLVFLAALTVLIAWLRPDLPASLFPTPRPTFSSPTPNRTASPTVLPTQFTPLPVQASATPAPSLTPTITPSPTLAFTNTPLGNNLTQIAFASNRSNNIFQIWLMNADGSQLRKLTDNPNGACEPAWSPDGQQILFISPCQGKDNYAGARIYVMNYDGKDVKPLPIPNNPEGDYHPAWSPDGKRVAYTSKSGSATSIFVFNFDDGTTIDISKSKALDSTPAWSPNGKQIAFTRQTVTGKIWLMTDKGENQTPFNLSDSSLFSFGPAWSSDGTLIFFSQMRTTPAIPWMQALRVKDIGINADFRIPSGGQDIGPVAGIHVSPDGQWIVYESWPDGKNHEIYRMTINGSDRALLTTDPAFDFGPTWRPVR
jgi:serine/threonine protein kinase